MAERMWQPSDVEVERALVELGAWVAYPATPPLAARVRQRLQAETTQTERLPAAFRRRRAQQPIWFLHGLGRRIAVALLALALAAAGTLALSPAARTAVAQWFALHGIVIFFAPGPVHPAAPLGTHLQLGRRMTLAMAQARVRYRILLPTLPGFTRPDDVYLGNPPLGDHVALVYHARPGLPRAGTTGVGLLVIEFRGATPAVKALEPGTQIELVTVNGTPGYWITGRPHYFWYIGDRGLAQRESVRLAGNVLLWERAGLLLRLEAALGQGAALRIAGSVR